MRENADVGDGCVGELGEGLVAAIVAIVILAFVVLVAIPLVVAVLDVAFVVLAGGVAVGARGLFGRPWQLEASNTHGELHVVRVQGWRQSGEELNRMVELLQAGLPIPGATRTTPTDPHDDQTSPDEVIGASSAAASAPRSRIVAIGAAIVLIGASAIPVALMYLDRHRSTDRVSCPTPIAFAQPAPEPQLLAKLVGAGTLSVEDAVGGKYGSDARRAALLDGSLTNAEFQDWRHDSDLTQVRILTFRTPQQALDYAAVDAEAICAFLDATFTLPGLPDLTGVKQPWETGPAGWWAGTTVGPNYIRAYLRSDDPAAPNHLADALTRALPSR